jgi:hypothetical protein
MTRRRWEYGDRPVHSGTTERRATAYSIEPVAIYAVDEQMKKRGRSTFHAALLSEVGWHSFNQSFRTLEDAQSFCESNVDKWRSQIATRD